MKKLLLTNFFILLSSWTLFAQIPDWSTSVATIIYDHCSVCHHEGAIAPIPFMSYDDAALYGFSIQSYVNSKKMPPWPPDPNYNHLAFEKVLSDDELNTINEWVDNGMPPGDLGQAPPPPVFSGALLMQQPDDTVKLPVYTITSNDDVYMSFVVHSNYTETKYVNQLEFVPGDPSLVHHAIYYQDTSNVSWQMDQDYPGPGYPSYASGNSPYADNFGGYVPGQGLLKFPPNMGLEIPAGADFVVDIHFPYGNLGKTDSSKLYLKFCQDTPVRPIYIERYLFAVPPNLTNGPLFIPANTVDTFNEHALLPFERSLVGLAPHSHLICKSWEVFMVTAPGDTTRLVYIPQWDFGWQYSYLLTKVVKIPIGTQVYGEAVYDNTVNNPNNPSNPPQDVSSGQSTLDEMMACRFWVMDYHPGDEDIILDTAFYGLPTADHPLVMDDLSLKVFPNPTGKLVHFAVSLPGHEVSWSLVDPFGNVVKRQDKKSVPKGIYVQDIDVSTLASGIYFLTIQSEDKSENCKVIVSE